MPACGTLSRPLCKTLSHDRLRLRIHVPQPSRRTTAIFVAALVLLAAWLWVAGRETRLSPDAVPSGGIAADLDLKAKPIAEQLASSADPAQAERKELAPLASNPAAPASLRIELRYSNGDAGVDLQVVLKPHDIGRHAVSARRLRGQSDAAGRAEFAQLTAGKYQLQVLHPSQFEHDLSLAPGEARTLTIQFDAGILVRGQVLDRESRGVAGAAIWSLVDEMGTSPIAMSGPGGQFLLRDVQPYFGIGATSQIHSPSPRTWIQGDPGDEVEIKLILQGASGTVRGRVLSADSQAVAGALVVFPNRRLPWTFLNGDPMESVTQVRCRTDAEGRFLAEGLPPFELTVEVSAEGHGSIEDKVLVQAGRSSEITLRLTDTAQIHGRVLDENGLGLADIRVSASSRLAGAMGESTSDANGAYRLADLTPGTINLQFLAAGKNLHEELRVLAGEDRLFDLTFASGLQVTGLLVDKLGAPLDEWSIAAVAYRGGSDFSAAETDQRGEFRLEHMQPGCTYRLNISAPDSGFPPNLLLDGIRPGTEPLRIVVPDNALQRGSIRGRVLDAKGKPMQGFHMRVMHMQSEFPCSVDLRDDGEFLAEDLPAGRYWIFIALGPQLRNLPDVELSPGEDVDLGTIQAEELGSLSLQFLNPLGLRPQALAIFDQDMRWIGSVDLLAGGLTDYPMLPGSHFIQVQGEGLSSRAAQVVIRPGEQKVMQLRLESGVKTELQFSFADPEHAMTRSMR